MTQGIPEDILCPRPQDEDSKPIWSSCPALSLAGESLPSPAVNHPLLPGQSPPSSRGPGGQEVGLQGRTEKHMPCPPLCNKKGGARPRPETWAGALRSQMRSHGRGPLRMAHGAVFGKPPPHKCQACNRTGWGAGTLIFPGLPPPARSEQPAALVLLTLLIPDWQTF